MDKSSDTPKKNTTIPKKTITNFIRKVVKLETDKKNPIFESQLKKGTSWLKKTNDSWDY